MADVTGLGVAVRRALTDALAAWPADPVLVPASAGLDSTTVALALRDLGRRVTMTSFALVGHESRDFRVARANAKTLGLPFVPTWLPTDDPTVEADIRWLITAGVRGKAAIECVWPFRYVIDVALEVGADGIATGSAADGHYGLSKKALLHWREPVDRFDEFRRAYFAAPDPAQIRTVASLAAAEGLEATAPWADPAIAALYLGVPWSELNRPRQKEPVRRAFPELDLLTIYPHTNLQLGDSGIAALVGSVALGLAPGRWRSPVGAYNAIAAGTL